MRKYSVEISADGKVWVQAENEEEAERLGERVVQQLDCHAEDIPGVVFNVETRGVVQESRGKKGFHATPTEIEQATPEGDPV